MQRPPHCNYKPDFPCDCRTNYAQGLYHYCKKAGIDKWDDILHRWVTIKPGDPEYTTAVDQIMEYPTMATILKSIDEDY